MLSPSDFNNAVPQFTNGNYASNPLNPQYIAEPSSTEYNRGAEPLQTLPAQWWNWFLNRFTLRFNKLNIYVKNIFNELSQLLSLVSETPSGTEAEPTVGQLKDMFETKYPDYLKTTPALSNTYVPQTTMVNGYALSGNVTISCVACAGCNGSGTAFGTASTLNTGTAAGCIPIIGTALGTTNGQFVATDASGCLKPSGYSASSFRSSSWTPSQVACAGYADNAGALNGYGSSTSATANCIVRRDGNGYIYGSYFNSSISDENINSYSGTALIFSGSDHWFRRTPPSCVCVGSAGYATSAGSANTATSATNALNANNATNACYAKATCQCFFESSLASSRSGYGWCTKCCSSGFGSFIWLCACSASVIEAYVLNRCTSDVCCFVLTGYAGCSIGNPNCSLRIWIKGACIY